MSASQLADDPVSTSGPIDRMPCSHTPVQQHRRVKTSKKPCDAAPETALRAAHTVLASPFDTRRTDRPTDRP